MDLRQLEYFVRVAELGSFTRAAHALGVVQPALSRQIRALEVELRQHLLVRNGRGAVPTEAGKVLLAHARGILHQVQRAREELGRVRGALAGRVAIGLPPSLARTLAVPLTRAFRRALPQATLSISEGLTVAMLDALTQGHLDLVLAYNPPPLPDITLQPLFDEPLALVQRRQPGLAEDPPLPVPLREVATLPLIIPSRPNALRVQVEAALAMLGLKPQVELEIDGVAAILELVADGVGVAILSPHALVAAAHADELIARPLSEPALHAHVMLACSDRRPATLTQQAAADLIRALCAERFGAPSAAPSATSA
ncbi:LysR substrate-binding domain-containing protein [Tepidimonas aquatica]|uniref:HTH-type transcriptional regulator CynR n=1 Tax=Tepidimonas aquatica TaxID=247482 RepID=A0A554WIU1_9BURK|nr:LysR substrate-binding domain-containing protein [Tepidimonas aquatica]TSE23489.1 HTH-type transcriptional regulator CynR [Tepidimonas aquatica]